MHSFLDQDSDWEGIIDIDEFKNLQPTGKRTKRNPNDSLEHIRISEQDKFDKGQKENQKAVDEK
jgi:hypothetical protein